MDICMHERVHLLFPPFKCSVPVLTSHGRKLAQDVVFIHIEHDQGDMQMRDHKDSAKAVASFEADDYQENSIVALISIIVIGNPS